MLSGWSDSSNMLVEPADGALMSFSLWMRLPSYLLLLGRRSFGSRCDVLASHTDAGTTHKVSVLYKRYKLS